MRDEKDEGTQRALWHCCIYGTRKTNVRNALCGVVLRGRETQGYVTYTVTLLYFMAKITRLRYMNCGVAVLWNEEHNAPLHARRRRGRAAKQHTRWRWRTYGTRYTTLRYMHTVAMAYLRNEVHKTTLHEHGDVGLPTGRQHYVTCTRWRWPTYGKTTLRYMHTVALVYLRGRCLAAARLRWPPPWGSPAAAPHCHGRCTVP